MQARRLFIVGDSLFADALVRILALSPMVQVVGFSPTPHAALERISETLPEAIIVAGTKDPPRPHWGQLLVHFPNIPLIRADLATNNLLLITCKPIHARPTEFITALTELPQREHVTSDE